MPGYIEDGFVVADSDVEYIESRTKKRMTIRAARREQDRSARRKGATGGRGAAANGNDSDSESDVPPKLRRGNVNKTKSTSEKTVTDHKKKAKAKATKERAARASAHKKELEKELKDLVPWGGLPTHPSSDTDEPSSDDEPLVTRVPQHLNKTSPSRARKEQAAKKQKRVTDTYRINKKAPAKTKPKHIKPKVRFEELAGLKIEQKGFKEWHTPLLSGQSCEEDSEMSDTEEAHQAPVPFRFLDLPGELRNRIYTMLIEDQPVASLKKQTTAEGSRRSPRNGQEKGRFYCYGLAQSCTLLRREFLPIIRQTRRVQVCLTKLYEYIDAFHPPTDAANNPHARAEGTIEPVWHDLALSKGIDVVKLARIAHESRRSLHFILQPEEHQVGFPECHELATLAQLVATYSLWQHTLTPAGIRAIILSSEEDKESWWRFDRCLEFKSRGPRSGGAFSKDHLKAMGEFMFRSGLSQREDLSFLYEGRGLCHYWQPYRDVVRDIVVLKYLWRVTNEGGFYIDSGLLVPDAGAQRGYKFVQKDEWD